MRQQYGICWLHFLLVTSEVACKQCLFQQLTVRIQEVKASCTRWADPLQMHFEGKLQATAFLYVQRGLRLSDSIN